MNVMNMNNVHNKNKLTKQKIMKKVKNCNK